MRIPRPPIYHAGLALFVAVLTAPAPAQLVPAPERNAGEGGGPYERLAIRGCMLIDGTGGPPRGPVTILVRGNRIVSIGRFAGRADRTINATGMYAMPGFVDMHAHLGDGKKAPRAEYVYKLWLAHGVTTVRGVPLGPHAFTKSEQARSAANRIVAPRIFNYQRPHQFDTPQQATEWVEKMAKDGLDGLKLGAERPEIMRALCHTAKVRGLGSVAHLAQNGVAQMNALDAARAELRSVTHFYGHFEALLRDHTVQPYPPNHNYDDEQMRFAQAARLWDQVHPPGTPQWDAYLKAHRELGTVWCPTLAIYSASRDLMRARTAEWHATYTLPSLWDYFQPSRKAHGSYWFDWTTHDEVAWRNFYRVWMRLVNDYKKLGGRITTGADAGFIYKTYGFAYIEELEMLQEAGLHPLEVIRAATMNGALTLMEPKHRPIEFGVLRKGMLADIVLVGENPLANLKVLYGTGHPRLNAQDVVERVGGIRWTIKDGIVYDAKQLLADVAAMVTEEKRARAGQAADTGR
ncbi:MAG: amidohydrolase [Planctomycetes bacterium]|nr:amidohydrolase [Planctomycetota bacterium]MCB9869345.1 amidohydrolase [Planctomycetota bacterium]